MAGHCPEIGEMTMKKTETTKHPRGASASREVVRDWQPLFVRLQDTIEWALDLAARLAGDYDEDLESIERVRSYVRGWLGGRRIDIDVNDLLTTLGILFAAIELDRGIDSSSLLEPLRAVAPSKLHLPGVERDERNTVVIRLPRRRNACGAFTQFAA
jgi:hypothetical protein